MNQTVVPWEALKKAPLGQLTKLADMLGAVRAPMDVTPVFGKAGLSIAEEIRGFIMVQERKAVAKKKSEVKKDENGTHAWEVDAIMEFARLCKSSSFGRMNRIYLVKAISSPSPSRISSYVRDCTKKRRSPLVVSL